MSYHPHFTPLKACLAGGPLRLALRDLSRWLSQSMVPLVSYRTAAPLQARLAGGSPLRLDLQDLFRSHSLDTVGLVSLRARLDTLRRSGQVAQGAERVAGGLWGCRCGGGGKEGCTWAGGLWGCGCNGLLSGCWPACVGGGLVQVAKAPHAWGPTRLLSPQALFVLHYTITPRPALCPRMHMPTGAPAPSAWQSAYPVSWTGDDMVKVGRGVG